MGYFLILLSIAFVLYVLLPRESLIKKLFYFLKDLPKLSRLKKIAFILMFVSFVVGLWGFLELQYDSAYDQDLKGPLKDDLYGHYFEALINTVWLYFYSTNFNFNQFPNWQVMFARFTAPLSLILLISSFFADKILLLWDRSRFSSYHDHYVVIGLGKNGLQLASDIHQRFHQGVDKHELVDVVVEHCEGFDIHVVYEISSLWESLSNPIDGYKKKSGDYKKWTRKMQAKLHTWYSSRTVSWKFLNFFYITLLTRRIHPQCISIEKYIEHDRKMALRRKGIKVLDGDALDLEILRRAAVQSAYGVIISAGTDIVNMQILEKVKELIRDASLSNSPRIFIQLDDLMYSKHSINKAQKHDQDIDFEIEFFNYYANATSQLLLNQNGSGGLEAILKNIDTITAEQTVNVTVIGLGGIGQQVVLQLAMLGHFFNARPINITIVDMNKSSIDAFLSQYFRTDVKDQIANVRIVEGDIFNEEIFQQSIVETMPQLIVIALNEDEDSASVAVNIEARLKQLAALYQRPMPKIAVRLYNDITFLNSEYITTFAQSNKTIGYDIVINRKRDRESIDLNYQYILKNDKDYRCTRNTEVSSAYSIIEWKKLSYFDKESNRMSAAHQVIKTKTLEKLGLQPSDLSGDVNFDDDSPFIKLVDMEHRRWNAFHYLHGWRNKITDDYDHRKDKASRLHACLVKTARLPDVAIRMNKPKDHFYKNDLNSYL